MKLTTQRLKKLIREELKKTNEMMKAKGDDPFYYNKGSSERDPSGILFDEDVEDFFNTAIDARNKKGADKQLTNMMYPAKDFFFNVIDYGNSKHAPPMKHPKYIKAAKNLDAFLKQYLPAMIDGDDSLKQMKGYQQLVNWMQWYSQNK